MSHALDTHYGTHDEIDVLSLQRRGCVLGGLRTSERYDFLQALFELGLGILVAIKELEDVHSMSLLARRATVVTDVTKDFCFSPSVAHSLQM